MTSSNGSIFRVTGPLCGEFTDEFHTQRPVTRGFGVFFDQHLNKRLSKLWWAGDLRGHDAHYDVTVMGFPTEIASYRWRQLSVCINKKSNTPSLHIQIPYSFRCEGTIRYQQIIYDYMGSWAAWYGPIANVKGCIFIVGKFARRFNSGELWDHFAPLKLRNKM